MQWLKLVCVLSLAAMVVEATTAIDDDVSWWQKLRHKLSSPVMRLFYHPTQDETPLPLHWHGLDVQDIFFQTDDKVRLHGRFYSSTSKARGTIVQFHGNAGNITNHVLIMLWLVEHGYNLFVFDYRGFGQSQATPSPAGLYQDALAALRQAENLHRAHAHDGVYVIIGQSLGGAVVLKALEDFTSTVPLDLLVLDSTFASYRNVALKVTSSSLTGLVLTPLAWLLVSDAYAADLQRNKHRLLILHAKGDATVPFSCGQRIYANSAAKQKTFWTSEANTHVLLSPEQPELQQRFLKLLSELPAK